LRQARALVDLLAGLFPQPGLDALRARCAAQGIE
jgi:hypothetical protein